MKKSINYSAFLLFVVARIYATDVGGNINTDTQLSLSNSPYYLTDNVVVEKNVTLDIGPGVIIYCTDKYDRYKPYSFKVKGTLKAIGNATDSIIFNMHPNALESWGGIIIYDSTNIDSSMLKYCSLRNSNYGIECNQSAPTISNCFIEGDVRGILTYGDSSLVPNIMYNRIISDNKALMINNTSPIVTNNVLKGSVNSVACLNNSSAEFHYNDFYGTFDSHNSKINAENNYWGTSDGDSITIKHYINEYVDYTPFLNSSN